MNDNNLNPLFHISPKYKKVKAPFTSYLIFLLIWAFLGLSITTIFNTNTILSWLSGILYILYDTLLLWHTKNKVSPFVSKPPPSQSTQSTSIKATEILPISLPYTVGVAVPAYNEEKSIKKTVQAILDQDFPFTRVLIVDDGSTDETSDELIDHFWLEKVREEKTADFWQSRKYPFLCLIKKHKAGKAIALNVALEYVKTDIIITLDADTILQPNAVYEMVRSFAKDPSLIAAAGTLVPVCQKGLFASLLQWFQKYEYIRAIISRCAWMRKNCLLLVSGAFAGFRREAIVKAGGFDPTSIVEDYELIHRLYRYATNHNLNWKVKILTTSRAFTDAPNGIFSFIRQRQRWFSGFLETQYWNKDMVGNPDFDNLGMIMMPIKAIDTLQPIYGLTAFGTLCYLIYNHNPIIPAILAIIIGKIIVDLFFHLWSVKAYYSITKQPVDKGTFIFAFLAAIFEPFSFQLLRHFSAFLGWLGFLTRRKKW